MFSTAAIAFIATGVSLGGGFYYYNKEYNSKKKPLLSLELLEVETKRKKYIHQKKKMINYLFDLIRNSFLFFKYLVYDLYS